MKDKQSKYYCMNDHMKSYQEKDQMGKQVKLSNELVEASNITQDELKSIQEYNTSVTNLNPLYANLQPLSGIIVRVFLLEPEIMENGLLIPTKQIVQIPTQSGVGSLMEIESPFPYSQKAVIVAVNSMTSLKQGDIVQLASNQVKAAAQGAGKNTSIIIPSAYMHPDAKTIVIPENSSNEHYGYLLIAPHEISVKL